MSAERLAADEALPSDTRKRVEHCSNKQKDCGGDQTCCIGDQAKPLDDAHDEVYGSAHVVRLEAADEAIKCGRGRADAEEQGDFDEDEDECADAVRMRRSAKGSAYRGPVRAAQRK